jgi:hypothetical protein
MDKTTQQQVDAGVVLPLMEAFYTLQGKAITRGVQLILSALGVVMWAVTGVM